MKSALLQSLSIPWLAPVFATGSRFSKVGFEGWFHFSLGVGHSDELLANEKWDASDPWYAVASWLIIYYHQGWLWWSSNWSEYLGDQMAASVDHYGINNGHKDISVPWLLLSAPACLLNEHYKLRSLNSQLQSHSEKSDTFSGNPNKILYFL